MACSGSRWAFVGQRDSIFLMRDRLATRKILLKIIKIIKYWNGKLSNHHNNGNVLKRTSMDINLFNKSLWDEIQMLVLLTMTKNLGLIGSIFKYLSSLLVKDTHDRIFRKNTSYIPGDNGSSLNITIRMKIIALTNITLIETSVIFV